MNNPAMAALMEAQAIFPNARSLIMGIIVANSRSSLDSLFSALKKSARAFFESKMPNFLLCLLSCASNLQFCVANQRLPPTATNHCPRDCKLSPFELKFQVVLVPWPQSLGRLLKIYHVAEVASQKHVAFVDVFEILRFCRGKTFG